MPPSTRQSRQLFDETGCTERVARGTVSWVGELVERARQGGCDSVVFPTDAEMATTAYRIFDRIAPHGCTATPGSAHAAVEAAVLDPARDETGLVHEQRERRYCEVRVVVGVMR